MVCVHKCNEYLKSVPSEVGGAHVCTDAPDKTRTLFNLHPARLSAESCVRSPVLGDEAVSPCSPAVSEDGRSELSLHFGKQYPSPPLDGRSLPVELLLP